MSSPAPQKVPDIDADEIFDWLTQHPNFLVEHPTVLEHMELPKESNGTLSFEAYQASRLRNRNAHLEALFKQADRNQVLIDHVMQLAAESLEDRPRNLRAALEVHEKRLRAHFPSAEWAIRLRPEIARTPPKYRIPEHSALARAIMLVFRKGPQVLTNRETVELLWPEGNATSDTVIVAPLKGRRRYGILCRELPPDTDYSNGTAILEHVAHLTAAVLGHFCKPVAPPS